jgi:hypothetical protein
VGQHEAGRDAGFSFYSGPEACAAVRHHELNRCLGYFPGQTDLLQTIVQSFIFNMPELM